MTVGELIELLDKMPNSAPVQLYGEDFGWYEVGGVRREDQSVIIEAEVEE